MNVALPTPRPPCRDRKHKWRTQPPTTGTPCNDCDALYGVRNDPDRKAGFGNALAAVRGLPPPGTPPVPALPAQPAAPAAPPPPIARAWHAKAAKALTTVLFVVGDKCADLALKKANKEVEETDDDDEERKAIEAEFAEQMPLWFRDTDVAPWGRALILYAGVMGEKIILARDIPPPKAQLRAVAPAPAATPPASGAAPTSKPASGAAPATTDEVTADA